MTLYTRKLMRELRAQRGQSLAVVLVTALGVMLFVSSAGAYRDLSGSYAAARARLALAGLHVDVTEVGAADVARVAALPGVASAEARVVAELPVSPDDAAGTRAALRVLSLPDEGEPALDRVLVLEGALPGDGEVLLEKHFAEGHRLGPGGRLPLGAGAGALRVSGVALSAEYLWVARDENDFMPSPDEFGVGWMRRRALRRVAAALLAKGPSLASPSLAVAAGDAAGDQLLVEPRDPEGAPALAASLPGALGEARVLRVTRSGDLVGVKLLQMDVDGYRGMAAFFPVFFLGVGAFIVATVLARLVDAQRVVIGTFLALGVGRARILRHYLAHALVLGGTGSALGGALGLALAPALTREYAAELDIPFVSTRLQAGLFAWGLVMGLAVSTVAGLAPALRATRLAPAEAMRPPRPSLGPLARLARRLPAPLPLKLAARSVLGRPLRSLGTALGVAAAIVLVLSTGALLDSMKTTFSALFGGAERYDVRVDFAGPRPAGEAAARVATAPEVRAVEALLALPARLSVRDRHADVLLQALAGDAALLRAVDVDGRAVPPGPGGLSLTRGAARALGVALGDEVEVTPLPSGPPVRLRVTGFADAAMGPTATARRADVEGPWHLAGQATSVLATTAKGRSQALRAALAGRFPDAARIEDTASTRGQYDTLMGLGWLMLSVMLGFGGVLAAAILFNTATLSILERRRELATLRALGMTMREVAALVTAEHALLAVLGGALGVPLAVLASKAMLRAFRSNLFSLPFVLAPSTVAFTLIGVLCVVLLSQWPALRQVSRSSLADAVREREG